MLRVTDQCHAIVLVVVDHPVVALDRQQLAGPVIEAHPQLVGLPFDLRLGDALGLDPLTVLVAAAVGHVDAAIVTQTVMRFGLHAVALEEHRQARQLVPGALVALQVDLHGLRWRFGDAAGTGIGAAGQGENGAGD